jgi:LmbE family N-acetylglucosaminyl deacetylase
MIKRARSRLQSSIKYFGRWIKNSVHSLSHNESMKTPRLMAVLAHPDDESLGVGGTLAKYASEGIDVFLLTATRGDGGRYHGHPPGDPQHPGSSSLANIRESELRAAASVLGICEVSLLDYKDAHLDRANTREVITAIVKHLRRVQPDVVITFGPDGAYGHPDHIAISQFTAAAITAAAFSEFPDSGNGDARPHAVSKFYYIAWPNSTWNAYQAAFRKLVSTVDGVERQAVPWPEWEITSVIDTRSSWSTVWQAISCHESQITAYEALKHLSAEDHEALWGKQSFYRVFSIVNGGRTRETDLLEGIRP